jgi:hypothetical protein
MNVESIEIVICKSCGTKNRIRSGLYSGKFRCGSCQAVLQLATDSDWWIVREFQLSEPVLLFIRGIFAATVFAIPIWVAYSAIANPQKVRKTASIDVQTSPWMISEPAPLSESSPPSPNSNTKLPLKAGTKIQLPDHLNAEGEPLVLELKIALTQIELQKILDNDFPSTPASIRPRSATAAVPYVNSVEVEGLQNSSKRAPQALQLSSSSKIYKIVNSNLPSASNPMR